ncbi:hypothetical protein FP828_03550 [bacterium]|nr:hypothetical protein [Candidatus Omnitrophota bacterium]MBA3065548.1 hypothetical protein [bacterium]
MEINDSSWIINKYKKDPIRFLIDVLDVEEEYVWDKMRETARSVLNNKYTAVKAGHSVSKTYLASRLALWFLYCFGPKATVITTAPSQPQVEEVLWREIRDAHTNAKIPLGGHMTKTKLELAEKWFAYGFATKSDTVTQQATRFQGFHNENILIIFDEAAGILSPIWGASNGLMTAGNCHFLAVGNPTSCDGEFVECFKDAKFNKITISVMDTPNFKAGKEIIPGLSGQEFEMEIANKFGRDSNVYKARVLGEIPTEDVDSIISISDFENAYKHSITQTEGVRRFVVGDPADGGDESVFYYMEDTDIKDALIFQKKNPMVTAGMINIFMEKHEVNTYAGDCIGIGTGVNAALADMGRVVIDIDSRHGKPHGVPDIYYNLRAQIWIEAGEAFSMGDIFLTWKDDILREQLTTVKQTMRSGRILIEPKDALRTKLGRSPDRGDTYVMGLFARQYVKPDNHVKSDKKYKEWKKKWGPDNHGSAMAC